MGPEEEYKSRKRAYEAAKDKKKWWFKQPEPIDRFTGWLVAWTALLFVATIASVVVLLVTDITLGRQAAITDAQLRVMRDQLNEMKVTSRQTELLIESNRKLADAASKQADAAVEAVKVSQNSLIASQRAHVGPRNARMTAEPKIGNPIEIIIDYQNMGREPARNFTYEVEILTSTVEDERTLIIPKTVNFMKKCEATPLTPCQVVYPTTGFSNYNLTMKIPVEIIRDDVVSGKEMIFIQGCFTYETSGAIRHSFFCYFYDKKRSKIDNMNICIAGHQAD